MNILLRTLCMQAFAVWVENALTIKRSAGLQQDKHDKVDAYHIAEYAYSPSGQSDSISACRRYFGKVESITSQS